MTQDVGIDPSWSIGGRPHGGYLLRTAVAAALTEDHPHPLAVSAHYLTPPDEAAAAIEVTVLRTGRRVATARVSLAQHGASRVEALVTTGVLPDAEPYWTSEATPPDLPPVEDCPRSPSTNPLGVHVGVLDHVDLRLDPATAQWALGAPAGRAVISGWIRPDSGETTPLDLLVFADAIPPVTFDLGLYGWLPTVELTVHLRGLPAPGWLRITQRALLLRGGWVDEECEIWDSAGQLVVQARQLAAYRLPDAS